jgi:hypothetical protein
MTMGLDICVGHPDRDGNSIHYSYSGFAHFRRRIARQIGIDLDRMVGFGGRRYTCTHLPKLLSTSIAPI